MSGGVQHPEPAPQPIGDAELTGLFTGLGSFDRIIAAVSGGPDSLALLVLLARWQKLVAAPVPALEVVTVDHGLRPASADEAAFVGDTARRLGVHNTILRWRDAKPQSGLQEAARDARYRLLEEHAAAAVGHAIAVATAHTLDDQAETVLMRLARGSGVDGLAAMAADRALAGSSRVRLVRPLLGVAKVRLVATLQAGGYPFVEDPSNADVNFERVRLRAQWPALGRAGIASEALALSAKRLRRAREALKVCADAALRDTVDLHGGAYASIDARKFVALPEEINVRLMARLLEAFGGEARAPGLSQVEDLIARLRLVGRAIQTLGGCAIRACPEEIRVFRETGRLALQEVQLETGLDCIWDRRFRVRVTIENGAGADAVIRPIVVRALGGGPYATLRRKYPLARIPARAAAGLPSFWSGGTLIGVPNLSGIAETPRNGRVRCEASFVGV